MDEAKYGVTEKLIGETPLQALERFRVQKQIPKNVLLAYAGRLDPMASGKLLILIGSECKNQEKYHALDKEYEFEVLFGVASDTGDVLGILEDNPSPRSARGLGEKDIRRVCRKLTGTIELPYPHFSSKTVRGKPLHIWTLENRLEEIKIPTKRSHIYKLKEIGMRTLPPEEIYKDVRAKIETIPKVTETSKELGNDFRRPLVRESWKKWLESSSPRSALGLEGKPSFPSAPKHFQIAKFRCIASSGTYMRTLAEVIAKELGTIGLAYSIHRTKIGKYQQMTLRLGFWRKLF